MAGKQDIEVHGIIVREHYNDVANNKTHGLDTSFVAMYGFLPGAMLATL